MAVLTAPKESSHAEEQMVEQMMLEEALGAVVVSDEKTRGDGKERDYGGGPERKNCEGQT